MQYCRTNGVSLLSGPQALPESFENISNLSAMSNEELAVYGWVPWIEATALTFDPITQRMNYVQTVTATYATDVATVVNVSSAVAAENLRVARLTAVEATAALPTVL